METRSEFNTSQTANYIKFVKGKKPVRSATKVVTETEVNLMVNGEDWLSFMCTPIQLEPLGIGFLYNENIIHSMNDVASCRVCDDQVIDIWLNFNAEKPEKWTRTSGCSGGKTKQSKHHSLLVTGSARRLSAQDIYDQVRLLYQAQEIYREARGVHCSALSDGSSLLYVAEDIGRHNSFDKLSGLHLQNNKASKPQILLTTGRISSEMIQKTGRLEVSFVISLTSPTSGSISIADKMGITLIGYAKNNGFNVYTHAWRIDSNTSPDGSSTINQSHQTIRPV